MSNACLSSVSFRYISAEMPGGFLRCYISCQIAAAGDSLQDWPSFHAALQKTRSHGEDSRCPKSKWGNCVLQSLQLMELLASDGESLFPLHSCSAVGLHLRLRLVWSWTNVQRLQRRWTWDLQHGSQCLDYSHGSHYPGDHVPGSRDVFRKTSTQSPDHLKGFHVLFHGEDDLLHLAVTRIWLGISESTFFRPEASLWNSLCRMDFGSPNDGFYEFVSLDGWTSFDWCSDSTLPTVGCYPHILLGSWLGLHPRWSMDGLVSVHFGPHGVSCNPCGWDCFCGGIHLHNLTASSERYQHRHQECDECAVHSDVFARQLGLHVLLCRRSLFQRYRYRSHGCVVLSALPVLECWWCQTLWQARPPGLIKEIKDYMANIGKCWQPAAIID